MIQREAVKRMFSTLPGLGIEFAKEGAAVVLHTAPAHDGGAGLGASREPGGRGRELTSTPRRGCWHRVIF